MFVGATGVGRVVERTVELMKEHDTDDVRPFGGIDVPTLQRYLNFHCSVSLDLFGAETSTNAANYFAAGLKGRFQEERRDDDHRLHEATTTVPHADRRRDRRARGAGADGAQRDAARRLRRRLPQGRRPLEPHARRGRRVGCAAPRRLQPQRRRRSPAAGSARTGDLVSDERVGRRGVADVAADGRRPGVRRVADGRRDRARQDGRLGGAAVDRDPRQAGRLRVRQDLIGMASGSASPDGEGRSNDYNACVAARPPRRRLAAVSTRRSSRRQRTVTYAELQRRGRRHGRRRCARSTSPRSERVAMVCSTTIGVLGVVPRRPAGRRRPGAAVDCSPAATSAASSPTPGAGSLVVSAELRRRSSTPSPPPRRACDTPSVTGAARRGTCPSRRGGRGRRRHRGRRRDDSPGVLAVQLGHDRPAEGRMHRHGNLQRTADTYGAAGARHRPRRPLPLGRAKLFFAYGLGNSLTFPFAVGATAILEPRGRRRRRWSASSPARAADAVLRQPRLRRRAARRRHAGGHVRVGARARDRRRGAARRPPAALRGALRPPRPRRHRLDRAPAHLPLQQPDEPSVPGTSGRPVPGLRRRSSSTTTAARSPADTPGYLHVRGDSMATGYWSDDAATRRGFRGDWLRTGDVYTRSADGYWTFLGRNSDMIKAGGIWVSPAEVEAVLVEHPDVLEAAVVGSRDDAGLERPVAFVVADARAARSTRRSSTPTAGRGWPRSSGPGAPRRRRAAEDGDRQDPALRPAAAVVADAATAAADRRTRRAGGPRRRRRATAEDRSAARVPARGPRLDRAVARRFPTTCAHAIGGPPTWSCTPGTATGERGRRTSRAGRLHAPRGRRRAAGAARPARHRAAGARRPQRRRLDRPAPRRRRPPRRRARAARPARVRRGPLDRRHRRGPRRLPSTATCRQRLARYHDDADATFRGWNDVWLSPEFRVWNIDRPPAGDRLPGPAHPGRRRPVRQRWPSSTPSTAASAGRAGRVVVPGVGHAPHLEAPTSPAQAVVEFITSRWVTDRGRVTPALTPSTYDDGVTTYDVPTSLSPSRVEAFTSCPMLFRFVSIEKIDDPPSIHTTRGSLVHRALELAFTQPAVERTPACFAAVCRAGHRRVPPASPTSPGWASTTTRAERLFAECRALVDNYLRMEDPQADRADRPRAVPRHADRRAAPARHHRPPRAA